MGIRKDVEESFKDFEFTKIEGQPTDEDINRLVQEISNAAASISTTLGGGNHGHVGMIIAETKYTTFSAGNATFDIPTDLGAYPTNVDENNAAVQEQQVAKHKAKQDEFHTQEAVASSVQKIIADCVDEEWLAEIKS